MYIRIRIILISLVLMAVSSIALASETGEERCQEKECFNGSVCEAKAELEMPCKGNIRKTISGNLTREGVCNSGKGWEYSEWSGGCECSEPYLWNGLFCKLLEPPEISANCEGVAAGEKVKTKVSIKMPGIVVADMGISLKILWGFEKGKEEEYREEKAEEIIIKANKGEDKNREIEISFPKGCKDSERCFYRGCSVEIMKSRWVNI